MNIFDSFNPELELQPEDAAELASLRAHPGFKVLQKIFKCGVDQFVLTMINTDQSNQDEVLARHNAARTAAQFYTWVVNAINNTVYEYVHSVPSEKPIDVTEHLDIGDFATIDDEEIL